MGVAGRHNARVSAPVSMTHSTTPALQMSHFAPLHMVLHKTSGATYSGVPQPDLRTQVVNVAMFACYFARYTWSKSTLCAVWKGAALDDGNLTESRCVSLTMYNSAGAQDAFAMAPRWLCARQTHLEAEPRPSFLEYPKSHSLMSIFPSWVRRSSRLSSCTQQDTMLKARRQSKGNLDGEASTIMGKPGRRCPGSMGCRMGRPRSHHHTVHGFEGLRSTQDSETSGQHELYSVRPSGIGGSCTAKAWC